jgi:heme-degrading monooxygenase HmoA
MAQKLVEGNSVDSVVNEYICIATVFPLGRWWHLIPFLRMSSQVETQLKRSPGLVRYGLRSDLPHKRFWTLSVWTDRESVNAFVSGEPHATAIRRLPQWVASDVPFGSAEWTSADGSIDWNEALVQLGRRIG